MEIFLSYLRLKMKPYKNNFFILLALNLAFFACDFNANLAEDHDIVIGVVETSSTEINGKKMRIPNFFTEGVKMAVDEINRQEGLLGRKLKVVQYDDEGSIKKGQAIATKLCQHNDLVAVIGHRYSEVAIPVSITYEKNRILFISPGATDSRFIKYSGDFTFRNIPSDIDTGRKMAEFAVHKGFKKMLLLYQRDTSGRRLTEIFHENITKKGIEVVALRSYFKWQRDFRLLISELTRAYQFDAILLAGLMPNTAKFIRQARDMGVAVPIIGGYEMDSPKLFSIAGRTAEGIFAPTVFNSNRSYQVTRKFTSNFKIIHGVLPDIWAAQGYDAVQLLAHVIRETTGVVPIELASTLRILENWNGVTGKYSFELDGGITDKQIFFRESRDGKFHFNSHEQTDAKMDPNYVTKETTLRLPLEGAIETIDPGLTVDQISIEIIEQLFLGLTDFDPKTYEPVPELAQSWSISDDGLVYTFKLRQDAFWTNGKPVTAHDLVWAVQRNIKPATNCPGAFMLYILKNGKPINEGKIKDIAALGIAAPDDYTVIFTLEHPAAYFPSMAGLWVYRPLPRMIIENFGKQWTEVDTIQTNGSYRLVLWKKGLAMGLKKNQAYFDAHKVNIPEIRYMITPESSLGMMMYRNDQIDIMGSSYLRIPQGQLPDIIQDPIMAKHYSSAAQFCTYAYGFNTLKPPLDNLLVRKAIVAAINRKMLLSLVTKGGELEANTFTRPPVFGAVNPKEKVGIYFNPAKARQLLSKAGYPMSKGLPDINLLYNASETHDRIAKAVQESLKFYLNMEINLIAANWSDYIAQVTGSDPPHIFRLGWCSDYPDANNWLNELFNPTAPYFQLGFKNEEFVKLMDQAAKESDPKKRKIMYKRAEIILCEQEVVVAPLYFETAHCLVKPRIQGWYHMSVGGQHIRNWSFSD